MGIEGIPMTRLNQIMHAVSAKLPKSVLGGVSQRESECYDGLWREAESLEARFGIWPTFEDAEIDSDDPALDIY